MAVTTTGAHPAQSGRAAQVTLRADDPVVRTAKLVQNSRGYFEVRYSEPRGGKGTGWRSNTVSCRTQNRAQAERFFDRFIDDAIAAAQGPTQTADQRTVGELCEDYFKSRPHERYMGVLMLNALKDVRINDVTPQLIHNFRNTLKGVRKDDSVRRALGVLRAAINHARRQGVLNIAPLIPMPPAGAPRVKWLTKDQLASIWDQLGAWEEAHPGSPGVHALKVFVFLASTYGARREAIRELAWERVDFEHRTLDFRMPGRTETKKRRAVVPMNDEVFSFLREVHLRAGRPTQGKVVASSEATLRYNYGKFFKAIGMEWVTSHVFRHTRATHMLMDGASIYKVARVLADTVKTVEANYAHVLPQDLRDVMETVRVTGGRAS